MRGGRRQGAGRPRGAKNKRTREVEAAMEAVAVKFAEAVPDAFNGDGVAFLQTVYKNPALPLPMRLDAAAKAARFARNVARRVSLLCLSNVAVASVSCRISTSLRLFGFAPTDYSVAASRETCSEVP